MPRKPRFLVVGVANYVIKSTDPLNSVHVVKMNFQEHSYIKYFDYIRNENLKVCLCLN